MTTAALKLGIVIVHYNTSEDLGRCLASLSAYAPACSHRIVVVDNASSDPGLAAVQRAYPQCDWLLNQENVGYSRGCNQGMARIDAEYYLVINPDIVQQPGSIDALLSFAHQHPKAGIIGPQLLNEDGSIQDSCRRFYTSRTLLLRRTFLGKLFPNSQTVQRHLMHDFDHESSRPVDWVLGGCILVRRTALAATGPMDERFFLYFEDVDWCYRMWRAGWEVLYTPASRFTHRHRRESAKGLRSRSFWLHLTSLISFYEKWGMLVYLLKKWRRPLASFSLWLLDMVALTVAFVGAYALRSLAGGLFPNALPEALYPLSEYRSVYLFAGLLATVTFAVSGRYRSEASRLSVHPFRHLQQTGTVALLLLASSYLGHQEVVSRVVLLLFLVLMTLMTALAGSFYRRLRQRMQRGFLSLERTLLVGAAPRIQAWLEGAGDLCLEGVDVVGYASDARDGSDATDASNASDASAATMQPPLGQGEVPWLGDWQDIPAVVERYRISQVVFWASPPATLQSTAVLAQLYRQSIRLRWRIDAVWLLAAGARAEPFGGQESGLVDANTTSAGAALLQRGLSWVGGLGLAIGGFLPFLWLRLVRIPRADASLEEVEVSAGWEQRWRLMLAVDRERRVLPLIWQWRLAGALLRGELGFFGVRLRLADRSEPQVEPIAPFWHLAWRRPGLGGAWSLAPSGRPATPLLPDDTTSAEGGLARGLRIWRQLWRDPGGLGCLTVATSVPEAPAASEESDELHPQGEEARQ